MNRVLIQFAHPALEKSRVNKVLAQAVRDLDGVTFRDLYEEYPELQVDVKKEQNLLESHDVIVFQHPFYWYSAPAIVKEWIDLVLTYGWAYGEGGDKLAGKTWVHAITAGGPATAYSKTGYNRFTVRELLAPFEQTAYLCDMVFVAPFLIHGALGLSRENDLPVLAQDYRKWVMNLRDGELARE